MSEFVAPSTNLAQAATLKHYWILVPLTLDERVLERDEVRLQKHCAVVAADSSCKPDEFVKRNAEFLLEVVSELIDFLSRWPTTKLPGSLKDAIGSRPQVRSWLFAPGENWRWLREQLESKTEAFFFSTHISRGVWEGSLPDQNRSELAWDAHVQVFCFASTDPGLWLPEFCQRWAQSVVLYTENGIVQELSGSFPER